MKVFVSSLISGMEAHRLTAREAIAQLGHEPVMAEDFGAQPRSPQIACLDGLRQSGVMLLILGADYGAKQGSGLSATHEEYREAKSRQPILVFVQEDVERDADQAAFLREVQAWDTGHFRGGFKAAGELKTIVTRSLHEWELSRAAGPVDPDELLGRVAALLTKPGRGYSHGRARLAVAVASGPTQAILRPSEIEKPLLADDLLKEALFGSAKLFNAEFGSKAEIGEQSLTVVQADERASITLNAAGGVSIRLPLETPGGDYSIIQEEVERQLSAALTYARACRHLSQMAAATR